MSASFLAEVDAMFDQAASNIDMPEGVAEKIKLCNTTYVTRFGVRLRGRMFTFRGGVRRIQPMPVRAKVG